MLAETPSFAPERVIAPRTAALAAVPLVGMAVAAVWSPSDDGIVVCPFRLATGGWCPLCGLTRATSQLVHRDWSRAFDYHPLVVPAIVTLGVVWLTLVGRSAGWKRPVWAPSRATVGALVAIEAVMFIAVWAARLGTGDIPRPFA